MKFSDLATENMFDTRSENHSTCIAVVARSLTIGRDRLRRTLWRCRHVRSMSSGVLTASKLNWKESKQISVRDPSLPTAIDWKIIGSTKWRGAVAVPAMARNIFYSTIFAMMNPPMSKTVNATANRLK